MANWNPHANAIFASLVELPASQLQVALDQACVGDDDLRKQVEALLAAHAQAGSFLDRPVNPADVETVAPEANGVDPVLGIVRYVGDYELLTELGRGGMGVVYKARQASLQRLVALKMILAGGHAGPAHLVRFRTECEAIARLQHPNIVQIYEVGEHEGMPFFSMEYCPGGSLDKKLNGTPWQPEEAARLVETLARAMNAAHAKNVIHRDLKPANVLFDADGTPKITDFGLAKKLDEVGQTASGAIMGTPSYMAPEQAGMASPGRQPGDSAIGPACDVYALGAILYELLTGRPPFKAATSLDTILQVVSDEPVAPTQLQPKTPRDLETICLKCLHKTPDKRYASAEKLAADLRRFQNCEPIAARPTGWMARGWKWAKRRPTAAALLLVSGVALLTLLAGGLWFNAQLTDERNEALAQKKTAEEQLRRAELVVYAGLLARAKSAYENNDGDLALKLLEACQWNLRGWEHRYLWTRLSSKATLGGFARINAEIVAFSPDGQRIYTNGGKEVRVWNALTGQELFSLNETPGQFQGMAISPDGHRILTGYRNGIQVWDADNRQKLLFIDGQNLVSSLAFSPDGRRFVSGHSDMTAKVWDSSTGRELLCLKGHAAYVTSVAFSPDGQRILTGSGDNTAKVWDSNTGQELFSLKGHTSTVNSVAFSPDGRHVLTGSRDETAKVWDAAKGLERFTLKGHTGEVTSVAYSPDGQRIVTGSKDKTARVWDAVKGEELFSLLGHRKEITSAAFSPEGQRIVTGGGWEVKVWNADKGQEYFSLQGHTGAVSSVALSPDSRLVVTGSWDGTAKVWNADTFQEQFSLQGHTNEVTSVAFSPDSRLVLTGSKDNTAKVWNASTGQELFSLQGHMASVSSVAFSPDGQHLLTGSEDGTAKVWDPANGRELRSLKGQTKGVTSVAFSPDGRWILTGCWENIATMWEATNGQELFNLSGHVASVLSVAFSPDGQHILTGSEDNTAKMWDARTGKELFALKGHQASVTSVAFSPDGQRILSAGGFEAKVWAAATGQELLSLRGHTDPLNSVAFSPDGQRIYAASQDKTIKVWDPDKGPEVLALRGHQDLRFGLAFWWAQVTGVAFSPDSRRVYGQGWEQQVLGWDTKTGQLLSGPPEQNLEFAEKATSSDGRFRVHIHQDGDPVIERLTDQPRDEHSDRAQLERLARFDLGFHTTRLAEAEATDNDFAIRFHVEKLLQHQPLVAELWVKQAHLLVRQGQHQKAALSLMRALLLNPHIAFDDPEFAARGERLAQAGNWPPAFAILRILVEQPKASPVVRGNLLLAELANGDMEAARRTASALIAVLAKQGDAPIVAELQSWLSAAPLAEADGARWEEQVRKALVRERNAETLHTHGVALYRAGQHKEAAEVLAESVKASGGDGSAETWLFQALAAQKQSQRVGALGWLARFEAWHQKQTFPDWRQRVLNQLLMAEAQRAVNPKHGAPATK